jgi:Family of unknown function (DUF6159)
MFTSFMDRINTSFALAKSSWGVLVKDKQLALFPVISSVACVCILLTFVVPISIVALAVGPNNLQNQYSLYWEIPVTFLFYLVTYFAIIFCNSALVSCALMRFNGETPTLKSGFLAAGARWKEILLWAAVSATVGLLLKLIENAHEKAGQIIASLFGTAWTIMTWFVVPILVVEKVGPFAAISRSIELMRKTWGEALAGNFGLGIFKFLLFLPGLLLIAITVGLFAAGLWPIALVVLVPTLLYLLAWGAVGSALDAIYLTALYQYAAYNMVPNGFQGDTMAQAFQARQAARVW